MGKSFGANSRKIIDAIVKSSQDDYDSNEEVPRPSTSRALIPYAKRTDGDDDDDDSVGIPQNLPILGVDNQGRKYLVFTFLAQRGREVPIVASADLVNRTDKLFRKLADYGYLLTRSKDKSEYLDLLAKVNGGKPKAEIVTHYGWVGDTYVLPDMVIAPPNAPPTFPYFDAEDIGHRQKFRVAGTLASWKQHVGQLAVGNSRQMFAVSLSFAPPLLDLLKVEQGGFELYGKSGLGKTGTIVMAGSVWGNAPGRDIGFGEAWNHTTNNIEQVAALHNDAFLLLDETRIAEGNAKARANAIATTAMRLAGGIGKGRLTNAGGAALWRMLYLSSSNLTFDEIARGGDVTIDDAYRVRLLDIPKPKGGHGFFDELHGYANLELLTQAIKVNACEHYGTPIRAFLAQLVTERSKREPILVARLKRWHDNYVRRAEKRFGGSVRIHQHFATAYLGGRLAIHYGVLPWDAKKLRTSILSCEEGCLRLFRKSEKRQSDALLTLRKAIIELKNRLLIVKRGADADQRSVLQAAGYVITRKGERYVGFTVEQFKKLGGHSFSHGAALAELRRQNALVIDATTRSNQTMMVKRVLGRARDGSKIREYVYLVKPAAIGL